MAVTIATQGTLPPTILPESASRRRRPGRGWAYAGLIFGSAGSITANVGHAFLRPAHAPAGWKVEPGAIAWGVAVAVALLISVEVLARVEWPATWGWRAVRYAGGSTVALVAAGTSYRHLSDLLRVWHETTPVVFGGPAIVDGLMILCSFALMIPATEPDPPPSQHGSSNPRSAMNPIEAPGSPIAPASIDVEPAPSIDSTPNPPTEEPDRASATAPGSRRRPPGRRSAARSDRTAPLVHARSDDLRRASLAVSAGDLPANPSATAIRVLLGISPAYARATRDALAAQPGLTEASDQNTEHTAAQERQPNTEPRTEKAEQQATTEASASSKPVRQINQQPITTAIN